MRAGKLDQKITFRTKPTTKSLSGEDVEGAPVEFATVYASVTPTKRLKPEFFSADEWHVKTWYDVQIRYLAGLHEDMEIDWYGRTLNILSIPDVGPRSMRLMILAQEQS